MPVWLSVLPVLFGENSVCFSMFFPVILGSDMWLHHDAPKRVVRCDAIEALSDFSAATIFRIFHHGAMS